MKSIRQDLTVRNPSPMPGAGAGGPWVFWGGVFQTSGDPLSLLGGSPGFLGGSSGPFGGSSGVFVHSPGPFRGLPDFGGVLQDFGGGGCLPGLFGESLGPFGAPPSLLGVPWIFWGGSSELPRSSLDLLKIPWIFGRTLLGSFAGSPGFFWGAGVSRALQRSPTFWDASPGQRVPHLSPSSTPLAGPGRPH